MLPRHGKQPDFKAAVHEAPKPAMKPVLRGANLQENCDDALPENGKLPNFAAVPQRADIQQECDGVLPQHCKAPDFKSAVHEAPKPAGKLVLRGTDLQANCDGALPRHGKPSDVPAKEPLHVRGPTLRQSLDTARSRPPRKKDAWTLIHCDAIRYAITSTLLVCDTMVPIFKDTF